MPVPAPTVKVVLPPRAGLPPPVKPLPAVIVRAPALTSRALATVPLLTFVPFKAVRPEPSPLNIPVAFKSPLAVTLPPDWYKAESAKVPDVLNNGIVLTVPEPVIPPPLLQAPQLGAAP